MEGQFKLEDVGNLNDRHNNPLNLKYGSATKYWVDNGLAEKGDKATDGGYFLKFKSPAYGQLAAEELLSSKKYGSLTVDAAMKEWSNQGYGAEVLPTLQSDKTINELSDDEKSQLVHAMAAREGYTGGSRAPETKKGKYSLGEFTLDELQPAQPSAQSLQRDRQLQPDVSVKLDYGNQPNDDRPWQEVMQDQAANVLHGIGLDHPIDMLRSLGASMGSSEQDIQGGQSNIATGEGIPLSELAMAPIRAIPHAINARTTALRGVASLADAYGMGPQATQPATNDEWKAAAEGSGELLANAPVIAGGFEALRNVPKIPAVRDALFRKPETLITRGLGVTDKHFQTHVTPALRELKKYIADTGTQIEDVAAARKGLEARTTVNNEAINKIVSEQADITVPGSKARVQASEIKAIPDDIRLHDPAKYERMVKDIHASGAEDYTIGELNKLRSELSATQSSYYGKDISGQLTMDAGTRATDIARGKVVRELFYDSLDKHGMGGGQAARAINSRIGSIIHMDDELFANANKSVAEKMPMSSKVVETAGKILSPGRSLIKAGQGLSIGVDKSIELALKRFNGLPEPVSVKLPGKGGKQLDLLPIGEIGKGPLLEPPPGTATGAGEEIFKIQQRVNKEARAAPPKPVTIDKPFDPATAPDYPQEGSDLWMRSQPIEQQGQTSMLQRPLIGLGATPPTEPVVEYPEGAKLNTEGQVTGNRPLEPPRGMLFGIDQSVYKWTPKQRLTYSLKDLQEMSNEYQAGIKSTTGATRQKLMSDLQDINHEIFRRKSAHRTPPAGGKQ